VGELRAVICCEVEECGAKGCDGPEPKRAATTAGSRSTAVAGTVTGTAHACAFGLGDVFSTSCWAGLADIGPTGIKAGIVLSREGTCTVFARAGEPLEGCLHSVRAAALEGDLGGPTVFFEWRCVAFSCLYLRLYRPDVPTRRGRWDNGCSNAFKGGGVVAGVSY